MTEVVWLRGRQAAGAAGMPATLARRFTAPASGSLKRCGLLRGSAPCMERLYALIERVAPTDATVLIVGESGTGKELAARTLHALSGRGGPFIAVNCAGIPTNLIEAELFGFERGSFTGANRQHQGVFERAGGGTLLLDEITEMAPEMQAKLLRVLETCAFTRVGGNREIPVDVRIIAATNRTPSQAVEQGHLRQDLLYRLAVFPIDMPPLRERDDDAALLARQFLQELNERAGTDKAFSPTALVQLRRHDWPGNVRELRNLVQRAFILADSMVEFDSPVEPVLAGATADPDRLNICVGSSLAEAERQLIFATLRHCEGNKRRTADVLGVSLKTLYNRLNEYQSGREPEAALPSVASRLPYCNGEKAVPPRHGLGEATHYGSR